MGKSLENLDFDRLFQDLGGFGRFQWHTYLLASFSSFVAGALVVASVFTSKTTRYRCRIPSCDRENTTYSENFLNFTTPWNDETSKWEQCGSYALVNTINPTCTPQNFNQSLMIPCTKWIYDRELFYRTTVTQYQLTCEDSWMVSLGSSSYMLGMLLGSVFIGCLSDKYGRRFGIFISVILLTCGSVIGAFAPYYEMLLFTRVIMGAGGMGCYQLSFVIAIEYVGPKYRAACGIFINTPFALGECFLGLLAYLIRDWRFLQIATASPAIIFVLYYWLMPESVRWLITQGRDEEALVLIEKAARVNNVPMPKYLQESMEYINKTESEEDLGKKSIMDLLRSKIIIRRSFILFYCWMVATMGYYGLSSYASNLSGNVFLNFTAVILIEIPSYLSSILLVDRMGRKGWHLSVCSIAGFACIALPFIPSDQTVLVLLLNLLGKFGVSAAFSCICLYTGELYPTEYRASGVGACSMNARIGGILAPFIISLRGVYSPLPALIFGILTLISGCLIILLPETYGLDLPQTIKESEQFGRDQNIFYMTCCTTPGRDSEKERIKEEIES